MGPFSSVTQFGSMCGADAFPSVESTSSSRRVGRRRTLCDTTPRVLDGPASVDKPEQRGALHHRPFREARSPREGRRERTRRPEESRREPRQTRKRTRLSSQTRLQARHDAECRNAPHIPFRLRLAKAGCLHIIPCWDIPSPNSQISGWEVLSTPRNTRRFSI